MVGDTYSAGGDKAGAFATAKRISFNKSVEKAAEMLARANRALIKVDYKFQSQLMGSESLPQIKYCLSPNRPSNSRACRSSESDWSCD